jgi:hypothetical protein
MIATAIIGIVIGVVVMWAVDRLPDCPKVEIRSRCCTNKGS